MRYAGNHLLRCWLLGCALAISFFGSLRAEENSVTSSYSGRELTVTATHSTINTAEGTWTTFYTVNWVTNQAGLGTAWVRAGTSSGSPLWGSSEGSTTGSFSYTRPTGSPQMSVSVWIDVYGMRDEKILTVDQPTTVYVSWMVANSSGASTIGETPKDLPVLTYRVVKNSQIFYTTPELKDGQTHWICIEFQTGGIYTLESSTYYPYSWDETAQVWVKNRVVIEQWSVVDQQQAQPGTCPASPPTSITEPDEIPPPPVENPVDPENPQPPPNVGPLPPVDADGEETTGTKWNNEANDDALDKKTFMEGMGKLEKQLQALNGKLAAGYGGGGSDPNADAIAAAATQGAGATDGQGKGDGADGAASSVQQAFNAGQATPSLSLSAGAASMVFSVPRFGAISIDPASDPVISAAAGFIKEAITWVASLLFAWFCWVEFGAVVSSLMQAQQAKGNPIIGGTGAQATALIAAAAITAILIAVPLAYWAFATYDITPPPTGSGAANVALYLLFYFVPVAYLLSLVGAAFVVKKAGIVLIAGTATLIRFIVP